MEDNYNYIHTFFSNHITNTIGSANILYNNRMFHKIMKKFLGMDLNIISKNSMNHYIGM